ncbi:MAG: Vitamin B12 transporter BtuB [Steroidobacteraceae bacterium]|nr:Vitamin B12 transporter BtuB [Steroidobacteraceae bacterium]
MSRIRQSTARLTVFLAMAMAALPITAATADTGAGELETVGVYARRATPISRVAATVTVISQDDIERLLATDVKELVRYEPGLGVRNDPLRFGLDTFAIRGVGGNRVAVEIDGIAAAGGFSVGAYSNSGRSFVDLAFVERIEVLRGPASSLYGSDAIGGIVAMSTLTPRSLLGTDGRGAFRLETGYASQDEGWHAAAIGAARLGAAEVLLGYVRRQGGELDSAADITPNPRDYVSDSFLVRGVHRQAPGGPLTLTIEGGRTRQDTSVDALLGTPPRFVSTTALLGDDRAGRYRIDLGQRLAGGRWFDTLDWRLYWQGTETRQDSFEQRRAVPPRTPPLEIQREFRITERTTGIAVAATRGLHGAALGHDLVYGLESSHSTLDELRDGQQTDLQNGTTSATILGETLPLRDFPLTGITDIGVFVQDEIRIGETAWSLIPALRADYYRLSSHPDRIYIEDNPGKPVVGLEELSLAPKLGVIRAVGAGGSVFLQYAHGFRSPPPEDVNIGFELPQLNYRAIPNPDLKPERSDGYEIGLRWRAAAVQLTASAFLNEYRDFIESMVNLGPDPVSGVTQFQSQNIADARIYGAELMASWEAVPAAAALRGWSARMSAAWTRGEDRVRDVPLASVEPARAVLTLGYEARPAGFGGQLVVTAVQAQRRVDRALTDAYTTGGYLTVDLLAQFDVGRGVQLKAGLFNLTDERYIEWADVRGRLATDPLIPYYTRPGRNLTVALRWRH